MMMPDEYERQKKERRELRRKAAKQRVKEKEQQKKRRHLDRLKPPESISINPTMENRRPFQNLKDIFSH